MIRSVTIGIQDKNKFSDIKKLEKFINFLERESQFKIRTFRLTLEPFEVNEERDIVKIRSSLENIKNAVEQSGIRWYCIPFEYSKCSERFTNDLAFDLISRHPNAFVNLIMPKGEEISARRSLSAAKLVKKVSTLSSNGYDNFRLGLSFNCDSNFSVFSIIFSLR